MEKKKPVFYFLAEGGELIYGQEACTEREARKKLREQGVRGKLEFLHRRGCWCE